MKNILIILLLTLLTACNDINKFITYSCPYGYEDCKVDDPLITSYQVDIKNQRILVTIYEKNKPIGNLIWTKDECNIFDEKNWKCIGRSGSVTFWSFEMIQGNLIKNPDNTSAVQKIIYITRNYHLWDRYML